MKKLTFAVLGMGNRGTAYAGKQLKFPEEMEVVAMADNRRIRLDAANKYLNLPEDRLFVPYENMIYIGDGMTDIPCMKMVKERGGKSIALYARNEYGPEEFSFNPFPTRDYESYKSLLLRAAGCLSMGLC